MNRWFAATLLGCFLLAVPVVAAADVKVSVLGIRSMEGDDEFALSLTAALRQAASKVPGWRLGGREISLSQMTLAHGCESADPGCLQEIASTLGTERIIYGTVRRTPEGEPGYEISLHLFDSETGGISASLTDTIPRIRSEIDFLRQPAEQYMRRLSGAVGTLRLSGAVPEAAVLVDGSAVGRTNDRGELTVEVAPGEHRVEVRAPGYRPFQTTALVPRSSEAHVHVTLLAGVGGLAAEAEDDSAGRSWVGWSLIGVGIASAAATVYTWFRLASLNDESDISSADCERVVAEQPDGFAAYRCAVPAHVSDVCDEAGPGGSDYGVPAARATAQDVCSEANTLEVLQWVFLGLTVGAGAAGSILLATDDDDESAAAGLSLSPRMSPDGGGMTATFWF